MSEGAIKAHEQLLSSRAVRKRYGNVVGRTLTRWEDDPDVDFPKHITITNGPRARRYWRITDLERWERERALASAARREARRTPSDSAEQLHSAKG
jgi:hypothetical protein